MDIFFRISVFSLFLAFLAKSSSGTSLLVESLAKTKYHGQSGLERVGRQKRQGGTAPELRVMNTRMEVDVGADVYFVCNVVSGPGEPFWSKEGGIRDYNGANMFSLTNVQFSDAGVYLCSATVGSETGTATTELVVLEPIEITLMPPGPVQYNDGDELNLGCQATAASPPMVSWMYQRQVSDAPYGINPASPGVSRLIIQGITWYESGQYCCEAIANDGRTKTKCLTVEVCCQPQTDPSPSPPSSSSPQLCGYTFPSGMPLSHVIARTSSSPDGLTALTVNYWAYFEELQGYSYPLSTMFDVKSNPQDFEMTVTSDNIEGFPERTTYQGYDNDFRFPLNEWIQVTYTWTASNGRYNLYVNGVLKKLGFEWTDPNSILNTADGYYVLGQRIQEELSACSEGKNFTDRFVGHIAHFQFWDYLLTDTQLDELLVGNTQLPQTIPVDDYLMQPFEIKDGAESFYSDCGNCPNVTDPSRGDSCNDDSWGYVAWDRDENDASKWTDDCAAASMASPIDVNLDALVDGKDMFLDLGCQNTVLSTKDYGLQNDGHSVKITIGDRHDFRLCIDQPNQDQLVMKVQQIRFNWASEHMVDGDRVPLECKVIMTDEDLNTHAIVIMFRLGSVGSEWIEQLVPVLPLIREPHEGFYMMEQPEVNFGKLAELINTFNAFYSYQGVATEPPCGGPVTYYIHDSKYVKVSPDQMSEFHCIVRCLMDPNQYRQNPYMYGNYRAVKNSAVVSYHNVRAGTP